MTTTTPFGPGSFAETIRLTNLRTSAATGRRDANAPPSPSRVYSATGDANVSVVRAGKSCSFLIQLGPALSQSGCEVAVYDLRGRRVASSADGSLVGGSGTLRW